MADLNQSNPLLLKYLIQNAIWWIEFANIDGFRVDTFPYNNPKPMIDWVKSIRNEYPNFNIGKHPNFNFRSIGHGRAGTGRS